MQFVYVLIFRLNIPSGQQPSTKKHPFLKAHGPKRYYKEGAYVTQRFSGQIIVKAEDPLHASNDSKDHKLKSNIFRAKKGIDRNQEKRNRNSTKALHSISPPSLL